METPNELEFTEFLENTPEALELAELIKKANAHRIVKMLYNSEITNDYSITGQLKYLKSFD